MNWSERKDDHCQTCEFQENLKILRQIPFFSEIPVEALKIFAYLCTREIFRKDDYLFAQDDDDGQAFYFLSGSAELFHLRGSEAYLVHTYGPGDFSGGLTLLGRAQRLFSLKAVSDTVCLILTREKFQKAIAQVPQVVPGMLQAVIEAIWEWERRFLQDQRTECEVCRKRTGVSMI
ncbi:Crp/Fnr family transcriptional regulator [Desulfatirhabdium butyrativorans]|uniref:Crp/Fnr family transcriptional regulator n=1 Tax=Desulfatirhabdium butyrativorans TaxID=340467 RepID=UPI0004195576|nr:cyclic nucleotide-binding domain-containing protein [Desulfatirhabdium butyrativorans]